jgi:hypothetical protein
MKVLRFRIAWLMVAVAVAALDFGAIRAMLNFREGISLILGALPMMNVLVICMLIGRRRPENRPFLFGFEAFGVLALAIYVALWSFLPDEALRPYIELFIVPLERLIGRGRPLVFIPITCFVGVVILGWPQVAFALIGGSLSRRFKISFTPRS